MAKIERDSLDAQEGIINELQNMYAARLEQQRQNAAELQRIQVLLELHERAREQLAADYAQRGRMKELAAPEYVARDPGFYGAGLANRVYQCIEQEGHPLDLHTCWSMIVVQPGMGAVTALQVRKEVIANSRKRQPMLVILSERGQPMVVGIKGRHDAVPKKGVRGVRMLSGGVIEP